jgi:mono/diheme cytochrome c family protein
MQHAYKFFILAIMVCSFGLKVSGQKFNAPAWADTLKNPLKNNAAAAAEGKKLYTQYCVVCHGEKGKGDGPSVAGLQKKPANHTTEEFQKQSDGVIFWKISNGSSPMPGFKSALKTKQMWQLVNYTRTFAAKK